MFFPQTLLTSIDSLIYVDTDVLFFRSLVDVWHHFSLFNSSQLVALVGESEDPVTGWYNRFASHPFYGQLGNLLYFWHHNFDVISIILNAHLETKYIGTYTKLRLIWTSLSLIFSNHCKKFVLRYYLSSAGCGYVCGSLDFSHTIQPRAF